MAPDHENIPMNSHLLRLSGEIRNAIYELAMTTTPSIANSNEVCISWYGQDARQLTCDEPRTKLPAITQVSRQTREESLGVYYGMKTFVAYFEWTHATWAYQNGLFGAVEMDLFRLWLTAIGAKSAAKIKRIVMRFSSVHDNSAAAQQLQIMVRLFRDRLLAIEPALDPDCVDVEYSLCDKCRIWHRLRSVTRDSTETAHPDDKGSMNIRTFGKDRRNVVPAVSH